MFWIMEHPTNGYQTHNHLLLKGSGIKEVMEDFLIKKKLVNKKFNTANSNNSKTRAKVYLKRGKQ